MHLKADVSVTDGANCRLACSEVSGLSALRATGVRAGRPFG